MQLVENFDCTEVGVCGGVKWHGGLRKCGVFGCGEGYDAGGCEVGPEFGVLSVRGALIGGERVGEAGGEASRRVVEGVG